MRNGIVLIVIIASAACSSSSAPKKPDVLASVKVLSGASQQGKAGTPLASAIVVQAVDSSGRPLAGLSVIYGPSAGSSANPNPATTDATGKASTTWTLGPTVGPDTLLMSVTQNGTNAIVQAAVYATANP